MKAFIRDILSTVVLAVIIFLSLQFTVQSFIVNGPSMENSFRSEDRLLVLKYKVAYLFHAPERGDIAIFHPPVNLNDDYIKRIIGLPGETVEIKNRTVYINGTALDEPYVKETAHYTMAPTDIPESHYFVLGDNRNNSSDSHNGWTVPVENIVGKAWLSIWPPAQWGLAPNYTLDERIVSS